MYVMCVYVFVCVTGCQILSNLISSATMISDGRLCRTTLMDERATLVGSNRQSKSRQRQSSRQSVADDDDYRNDYDEDYEEDYEDDKYQQISWPDTEE